MSATTLNSCAPSPPPGATGQCVDGCFTFSEDPNDDDTCHGRGGLQKVLTQRRLGAWEPTPASPAPE
jgi:hypothetical protein